MVSVALQTARPRAVSVTGEVGRDAFSVEAVVALGLDDVLADLLTESAERRLVQVLDVRGRLASENEVGVARGLSHSSDEREDVGVCRRREDRGQLSSL